jgi:ribosome maturation factor RimP
MNIKDQITTLVNQKLSGSDNYLVEVKTLPGKVVVFIDHQKGVKLEDCIELSRYLHQSLETTDVFEKNELEVSSPGMDEPFKVMQQYYKRKGQEVSVITFDGMKRSGELAEVFESGITLHEKTEKKVNGKKEVVLTVHELPFSSIKETRLNYSIEKLLK